MHQVKNKLRVIHFPQVGSDGYFEVEVKDEQQAHFTENLLANQHLWLYKNNFIPDYSNMICVEMYDEEIDEETGEPYGWSNYYNEEEGMEWEEYVETYLTEE